MKFAVIGMAGSLALSCSASASSQAEPDGLLACSIVYARIAEIYGEKGDQAQMTSFMEASNAYGASALHLIGRTLDAAQATAQVDARSGVILNSLNQSINADPDGELGVIGKWLGWCDGISSEVTSILAARAARGW